MDLLVLQHDVNTESSPTAKLDEDKSIFFPLLAELLPLELNTTVVVPFFVITVGLDRLTSKLLDDELELKEKGGVFLLKNELSDADDTDAAEAELNLNPLGI